MKRISEGQPFITIYTDASLCPKTFASGWACWVKYPDESKLQASGPFEELIQTSTEAELKTIANAIYIALQNYQPVGGEILVIVTDSQQSLDLITKPEFAKSKLMRKYPANRQAVADIKILVPPTIKLVVKKVKAHSNKDGKRSYVNNLVDMAAKKAMIERRKTLHADQQLVSLPSVSTPISEKVDDDVPW